jgi:hypothetical protein
MTGCGPAEKPVNTIEDATALCGSRGVALTCIEPVSDYGNVRVARYTCGDVRLDMTQFDSPEDAAEWKQTYSKMPVQDLSRPATCGAVAIIITGGTSAERSHVEKAFR